MLSSLTRMERIIKACATYRSVGRCTHTPRLTIANGFNQEKTKDWRMATKSYRRCEKYSDAKCTIVCWEMSCGLWQIFQSFFKSRSPRHLPCTAREMPFDKRAQFSRRFDGEEINDESFCCKPAMAAVYDTRMAGGEREEESIKRLLSSGEACAFLLTGFGSLTLSRRDWRAKRLLIRTHRCAVTYKVHCLSTISSAATDPTNRVFKACFALGLFSRRTPQLYTCTLNVSGHLISREDGSKNNSEPSLCSDGDWPMQIWTRIWKWPWAGRDVGEKGYDGALPPCPIKRVAKAGGGAFS